MKAAADLNARQLPAVSFRPAYFQPDKPGEKFYGQMAGGVEIYFTDRRAYRAVLTTLSILDAYRRSTAHAITAAPDSPVAGLASSDSVQQRVAGYQAGIEQFLQVRQTYLLY